MEAAVRLRSVSDSHVVSPRLMVQVLVTDK